MVAKLEKMVVPSLCVEEPCASVTHPRRANFSSELVTECGVLATVPLTGRLAATEVVELVGMLIRTPFLMGVLRSLYVLLQL